MNQRINYVSAVIIDSLNQRLMYLMLQYVHKGHNRLEDLFCLIVGIKLCSDNDVGLLLSYCAT